MVSRRVLAGALAWMMLGGVTLVAQARGSAQQTQAAPEAAAPVNLNTATVTDLEKLPGVGPALATRILEYRQRTGGFKRIEDLMNVSGIGERSFLRLKPLVVVTPNSTTER